MYLAHSFSRSLGLWLLNKTVLNISDKYVVRELSVSFYTNTKGIHMHITLFSFLKNGKFSEYQLFLYSEKYSAGIFE